MGLSNTPYAKMMSEENETKKVKFQKFTNSLENERRALMPKNIENKKMRLSFRKLLSESKTKFFDFLGAKEPEFDNFWNKSENSQTSPPLEKCKFLLIMKKILSI